MEKRSVSRRDVLGVAAVIASSGVGGCLRLTQPQTEPETTNATATDQQKQAGQTDTQTPAQTTREPSFEQVVKWQNDNTRVNGLLTTDQNIYSVSAGIVNKLASDGSIAWKTNLDAPTGASADPVRISTPLHIDDTSFYTPSRGQVFALDTGSGRVEWNYQTPHGHIQDIITHQGQAIIATREQRQSEPDNGSIFGLDKESGELVWRTDYQVPTDAMAGRAIYDLSVNGEVLQIGMYQGLFKFDISSRKKLGPYEHPESGDMIPYDPSYPGGFISKESDFKYHTGRKLGTEVVQARDHKSGSIQWESEYSGSLSAAPKITDKSLCVGTRSGVYCYNRTNGDQRWRALTPERPFELAVINGVVVAATTVPELQFIDLASGETLKTVDIDGFPPLERQEDRLIAGRLEGVRASLINYR